MLANVKTEDFYFTEDEIEQLAADFGLCAEAVSADFMLTIEDEHFNETGMLDRLVVDFRQVRGKKFWLATQAFPNFYARVSSSPYEDLYTKEAAADDVCFIEKVIPKWTLADTDPFLKKIFDCQSPVLRKTEVNRILNHFTRNVKLHLQKGKIAEIKEAADQYSM